MKSRARLIPLGLLWTVCTALPVLGQRQAAPSPEVVKLDTRDGVKLTVTYYPSRDRGASKARQSTPVVMLHDFKDTRATLASLAQQLQSPQEEEEATAADHVSFAVVTVDLRGHGESTKLLSPDGYDLVLDPAKLGKDGLLAMATLDLEAVRSFLVEKNDAGELNLNKLCLVGAGMGASVAVNWAASDWVAPPLAVGKQGQDVKALVLVSPRWSFQGLTIQEAMKLQPLTANVAWMLIYGSDDAKVKADARRIFKQLERFHPEKGPAGDQRARDLVAIGWSSSLQGGTLLAQFGQPISVEIVKFLTEHIAKKETPWLSRRGRLP
jgi:pimeloyl-ACP methyl ester carboxylesterase